MCTQPIPVHPAGRPDITYDVPCGHCLECLRKYQNDMVVRLDAELRSWHKVAGKYPCVFFTLSYSDNKIPHTYVYGTKNGVVVDDYCPCTIKEPFRWNIPIKEDSKDARYQRDIAMGLFREQCVELYNEQDKIENDFLTTDRYSQFAPEALSLLTELDFIWDADETKQNYDVCQTDIIEIDSVCKRDVQLWLKRCRKSFLKSHPPRSYYYNGKCVQVSERMDCEWSNNGNMLPLPFAALTPTFHYFITSEYGPQTCRPHYHGVMFGVTEEEFQEFAEDWFNHFGNGDRKTFDISCHFEGFDTSKGGMLYLAKYCSKGEFEHPLCSRFGFDEDGNRFYSRHYYGSMREFGLDAPAVHPTFHLYSKGLGIRLAFDVQTQRYFNCRLYLDRRQKRPHYVCTDISRLNVPTFDFDYSHFLYDSKTKTCVFVNGRKSVVKHDRNGKIIAYSSYDDETPNKSEEERIAGKKYVRSYFARNKDSAGKSCGSPVQKTFASSLPRYYSRYLISPAFAGLRLSNARICSDELYEQQLTELRNIVQSLGQSNEALLSDCKKFLSDAFRKRLSQSKIRSWFFDFYNELDYRDKLELSPNYGTEVF